MRLAVTITSGKKIVEEKHVFVFIFRQYFLESPLRLVLDHQSRATASNTIKMTICADNVNRFSLFMRFAISFFIQRALLCGYRPVPHAHLHRINFNEIKTMANFFRSMRAEKRECIFITSCLCWSVITVGDDDAGRECVKRPENK